MITSGGRVLNLVLPAVAWLIGCTGVLAEPIRTEGGLVDGTVEDGLRIYRGIPFGASTTGDNRWRAPQPAPAWTGILEADRFGPSCPQGRGGDEDCLYLNIWTPAESADDRLPVMVWIYGGGFAGGATSTPLYSGEALAKQGVVYVSIAYRVGVMGFMAHPELTAESEQSASGNWGLLDQIAGLEWVRDNIAAFGGDPERVTIFGESAGGIAVSILAASPVAKGLFHGAMSESGGSFGPTRFPSAPGENIPDLENAERGGSALQDALGTESIAAMRELPAATVLAGARGIGGLGWPIRDGWVLPQDQYEMYEAGEFNDTPVLIGINSDEGASFTSVATVEEYEAQTRQRFGPFADELLTAYAVSDNDPAPFQAARDLLRDAAFGWHTWVWASLQSRAGGSKVFYYFFDQRPPYPADSRQADVRGVPHGAEMPYVFQHLDQQGLPWTADDRAVAEAMGTYWTNFVKYGDPNGAGLPEWPAFTEENQAAMIFDGRPRAGQVPNPEQLQVLDAYFEWRRTPAGKRIVATQATDLGRNEQR